MVSEKMTAIVTRKEALAKGLTRYFTGKPCPRGHVAERITNEAKCSKCERERSSKWSKANPERVRDLYRKYREANREKIREASRKYREANPEKIRERQRKYRQGGLVEKAKRKRA